MHQSVTIDEYALQIPVNAGAILLVLAGYNLVYALPFAVVPVFVALFVNRSRSWLQSINVFLDRVAGFLMPLLLFLLGAVLLADAVGYLVFARPLIG